MYRSQDDPRLAVQRSRNPKLRSMSPMRNNIFALDEKQNETVASVSVGLRKLERSGCQNQSATRNDDNILICSKHNARTPRRPPEHGGSSLRVLDSGRAISGWLPGRGCSGRCPLGGGKRGHADLNRTGPMSIKSAQPQFVSSHRGTTCKLPNGVQRKCYAVADCGQRGGGASGTRGSQKRRGGFWRVETRRRKIGAFCATQRPQKATNGTGGWGAAVL